MDPPHLGVIFNSARMGRLAHSLLERFPRLDVQTITPDFILDDVYNGTAETFWILVENCDGEEILLHDQIILRKGENNDHLVEFRAPTTEPMVLITLSLLFPVDGCAWGPSLPHRL